MIVRYHVLARREIIETAEYYASLRDGLGEAFLEEVGSAIDLIARNPFLFEEVRPGMRSCLLERFPYGVYYRIVDPTTIRIVVVKHHSRRPGFGMRRR
jgi:plasmid stabilization system protein ParE